MADERLPVREGGGGLMRIRFKGTIRLRQPIEMVVHADSSLRSLADAMDREVLRFVRLAVVQGDGLNRDLIDEQLTVETHTIDILDVSAAEDERED